MAQKKSQARILVASDNGDDAESVVARLKTDFEHVRAVREDDVSGVAEYNPNVVVLAFKEIQHSERFYLGLFRSGATLQSGSCQAVLLCSKEDVVPAFDLCKKGYFDDYVLYWPQAQDGMRLAMSVLIASREATSPKRLDGPDTRDLITHVNHLKAVDATLEAKFTSENRALLEPHLAGVRVLAKKVREMRLCVLVVEDDPLACEIIEEMLSDQPVDLMFAADAQSSFVALRRRRPDLILMDVRLPGGMDGVALTRKIKATAGYAEVPVVMLTGSAQKETVTASMNAGAASFLVKPLTREAVVTKLRLYMPSASAD